MKCWDAATSPAQSGRGGKGFVRKGFLRILFFFRVQSGCALAPKCRAWGRGARGRGHLAARRDVGDQQGTHTPPCDVAACGASVRLIGNESHHTCRFAFQGGRGEGIPVDIGASSSSSSIANAYSARHENDSDGVMLANSGFETVRNTWPIAGSRWGIRPGRGKQGQGSCDWSAKLSATCVCTALRPYLQPTTGGQCMSDLPHFDRTRRDYTNANQDRHRQPSARGLVGMLARMLQDGLGHGMSIGGSCTHPVLGPSIPSLWWWQTISSCHRYLMDVSITQQADGTSSLPATEN